MPPTPKPAPEEPSPELDGLYYPDEVFHFHGTADELADTILKPRA